MPSGPKTRASSALSPLRGSAQQSPPGREPRAPPADRSCCRGELAFAAGGPAASNKRRAGHQEVGAKNPNPESRGRAALPGPGAGSGGRWRSCERQSGEGGPRRGPPTGRGCLRPAAFADLRARSCQGPLGGPVHWSRASTRHVRELECLPARRSPVFLGSGFCLSQVGALAPGFGLPVLVAGTGLPPLVTGGGQDLYGGSWTRGVAGAGATGVP